MKLTFKKTLLICTLPLLLTACGGGGGGGSSNNKNTLSKEPTSLAFNFKEDGVLLANKEVAHKNIKTKSVDLNDSPSEFEFSVIDYSQTSKNSPQIKNTQTNLFITDQNGNTDFALDSNYPVKVLFTAQNPVTKHVFVALDSLMDGDLDFSYIIGENNCALFDVDPITNEFKCAAEGKRLRRQDENAQWSKLLSGNQKAIQFDEKGNTFFLANIFKVKNNGYCESYDNSAATETCSKYINNFYITDDYNTPAQIYKYSINNEVTTISQDNEEINIFLALKSGEVVYSSKNANTGWVSNLYMIKDNNKINLTHSNTDQLQFFATDSSNAVLFSKERRQNITVVKPGRSGMLKTKINTSLFGKNACCTNIRRIIVADNGYLYGVFENHDSQQSKLDIYQVLPYSPELKASINISGDWWQWMDKTPAQISKGYLYYVDSIANVTVKGESLGKADYIEMVNLTTLRKTSILKTKSAQDPRYDFYTWRLSGNKLYFSALDTNGNTVKTGIIDTLKVRNNADYLKISTMGSAKGSVTIVQDIEVLTPQTPKFDTGGEPKITTDGVFLSKDNRYSMSIDFSKYMNKESVIDRLSIKSNVQAEHNSIAGTGVAYFPIWIYKTLHLIPDLDGLDNDTEKAFTPSNSYHLDFENGMKDTYDVEFYAPSKEYKVTFPNANP